MSYESRLTLELQPSELFKQIRDDLAIRIEELADAGQTLTGDQLHEIAQKIRAIGVSA